MFNTHIGVIADSVSQVYLRPETAQGIFINFKNIERTQRFKLPFGVGQIGKAFRNEITPGNFIFRTREFEQMEIEYFCTKNETKTVFEDYLKAIKTFLFDVLKIKKTNIKMIDYPKSELAHYSSRTVDFLYNFPHGESELWGLADRGEFDLSQHQNLSKKNLEYLDENQNRFLASVIEPSVGVERLLYAILIDAYDEEEVGNEKRIVLRLATNLAPYQFAVFALSNKLNETANAVYQSLIAKNYVCAYDTTGSIGKRYRRQDAIGTPYCVTIDFDTLNDNCVTVRNRDSMQQIRIKIEDIDLNIIENKFKNESSK